MSVIESIIESYPDEVLTTLTGFDDAIIGIDDKSKRLVYSEKKIIECLQKDMTEEEAIEFYDYNVAGSVSISTSVIICSDDW